MKRYNNRIRRSGSGPGSKLPIKHNQKKPFNPGRYGKIWNTIGFKLRYGNQTPMGDANQPTMGYLLIDGKKHEVTWTEANKIMEAMHALKDVYAKAKRMGMIEHKDMEMPTGGTFNF